MKNEATLKEFLDQKDHSGFRLVVGYWAELAHGLMGNFPALESESGEMVMTTDINLLYQVCETLPRRRFKIRTQLLYANLETGEAYSILGLDQSSLEQSTRFQTLTPARFRQLNVNKCAFKWAPGLVGPLMSDQEFRETLEAAKVALT